MARYRKRKSWIGDGSTVELDKYLHCSHHDWRKKARVFLTSIEEQKDNEPTLDQLRLCADIANTAIEKMVSRGTTF